MLFVVRHSVENHRVQKLSAWQQILLQGCNKMHPFLNRLYWFVIETENVCNNVDIVDARRRDNTELRIRILFSMIYEIDRNWLTWNEYCMTLFYNYGCTRFSEHIRSHWYSETYSSYSLTLRNKCDYIRTYIVRLLFIWNLIEW